MIVLGTSVRRVDCQSFVDGGEVAVECTSCNCKGDSDDGTVIVFDNPSSGSRVSVTHVTYTCVHGAAAAVVTTAVVVVVGEGGWLYFV